ncbi:zinc finger, CCHC-type containing protein [Tanacetum coccineum]
MTFMLLNFPKNIRPGYLDNPNPNEPEWRDFIISENHTSSSRIIDEINTQDSERNDEDSAPSPTQNNTYEYMSDGDVFEQPIDNPSTPPPYTYEPNSEESTRYTSSTASSIRPFDHTPVQGYKNISEIYARAPEVQSDELLLLEEEPRNYKEVAQDKKWIKAMQIEIDSINKNKTWKLTTLPDKQKAIGLKGLVSRLNEHGRWKIIKQQGSFSSKGIEVTQTKDGISIKQSGYAIKILKEARMENCNKTKIPMDPGTKLIKTEGGELVDATEYRNLIGCLRYLLHTIPT